MIWDFNLLATCEPLNQSAASSELWMLLRSAGDEKPKVDRSLAKGLITARTHLDPLDAIARMRADLNENPDHFKFLLRIIPIQNRVNTSLDKIKETARSIVSRIGEDESFRVTLEKRRTDLRSREVIDAVAEGIPRRVDLENHDWIVLIEIVGNSTGVSVIRPEGILNVQKEKARLSTER
jgi:tRNA acetyltransferase TAN1